MLLKSYLKNISNFSKMTKEEEIELFKKIAHGDKNAKDQVITANLRLVVNIAKRYVNENLSLIDLIQEGNIGLIEAIDKFDIEKGTKFDTYAVWHIKRTIIRALGNKSRTIRVPVHIFEKYQKLRKIVEKHGFIIKSNKDIVKISKLSGFSPEKIRLIFNSFTDVYSLDLFVENDSNSGVLLEMIEDKRVASPQDIILENEKKEHILNFLNELDDRENKIVTLYYGLHDDTDHTLKELSDEFDLTKERIRQIKVGAIKKLQSSAKYNEIKSLQAA